MSDLKIGIIGIGAFGSRAAMRLLWQRLSQSDGL